MKTRMRSIIRQMMVDVDVESWAYVEPFNLDVHEYLVEAGYQAMYCEDHQVIMYDPPGREGEAAGDIWITVDYEGRVEVG